MIIIPDVITWPLALGDDRDDVRVELLQGASERSRKLSEGRHGSTDQSLGF